jgi:hypothetical protein
VKSDAQQTSSRVSSSEKDVEELVAKLFGIAGGFGHFREENISVCIIFTLDDLLSVFGLGLF